MRNEIERTMDVKIFDNEEYFYEHKANPLRELPFMFNIQYVVHPIESDELYYGIVIAPDGFEKAPREEVLVLIFESCNYYCEYKYGATAKVVGILTADTEDKKADCLEEPNFLTTWKKAA